MDLAKKAGVTVRVRRRWANANLVEMGLSELAVLLDRLEFPESEKPP